MQSMYSTSSFNKTGIIMESKNSQKDGRKMVLHDRLYLESLADFFCNLNNKVNKLPKYCKTFDSLSYMCAYYTQIILIINNVSRLHKIQCLLLSKNI